MSANTKTFTGKDSYDLDKQLWDWRSDNPLAVITKVHSDEALLLEMASVRYGEKILSPDLVSRRIEYQD
jgi:hypothetical protein